MNDREQAVRVMAAGYGEPHWQRKAEQAYDALGVEQVLQWCETHELERGQESAYLESYTSDEPACVVVPLYRHKGTE